MEVVYAKLGECPPEYKCSKCEKTKLKLWREYNSFGPKLFCILCAMLEEKIDIATINVVNKITGKLVDRFGFDTDQIGSLVPAIPDEEDVGYWGYTSVPLKGIKWWYSLKLIEEEKENVNT